MLGKLKFKAYKDFSKGTWNNAQNSVAPENSCKLGLNLNSDEEIGSLLSRKGTTIIGSQLIEGKDILGLHNYRDSLGTGDKLFAAVSDGSNTDIYDVVAGTKSLEDDTSPISISISPSVSKSVSPSTSISPSKSPSQSPSTSISPSVSLSVSPSVSPSISSASPSKSPSASPSVSSSLSPSISPSTSLSISPSVSPSPGSTSPSASPSVSPSLSPSVSPSNSISPSKSPSVSLSISPSVSPSVSPSQEDAYTKLLIHFDGDDAATTHTAATGQVVTFVGTAQLDTAQKEFGTASLLLDGNSDYVTVPDSPDFDLSSGDWTIDFWFRSPDATTGGGALCSQITDNSNFFLFGYGLAGANKPYMKIRTAGTDVVSLTGDASSFSDNTWMHIALVHSGTTYTVYVDGVSKGSVVDADNPGNYTGTLNIGFGQNETPVYYYLNGWVDEFRLSKGVARWTSSFTPPTFAYQASSPSASASPSSSPSVSPSVSLSSSPSVSLSASPSLSPSASPSTSPPNSFSPSTSPSISPSVSPPDSFSPSISASESPSVSPSISPSESPSTSISPSISSSISPSISPSISSSLSPSSSLSISPSVSPSVSPSITSYEGLKTRFLTYLNSCLRLNGINKPKAYNGTSWIDTGGVFDLANIPQASKYAIEFKDRIYVAGKSDYPDQVDISGIADPVTRTVSWTTGNRYIVFEQEDGGGGITGLWKVPGYVIVGKKRTLKRYDGSSAYPEDMVNQGIPTQECGVTAQGMLFFVNENGAWATEGGKPKKISTYTVDNIIKSCSDFMWVSAGTDEEHVFFSFPSVTISGETYTNVTLKYNIFQNTWDVRKYPTHHTCYAKYVDSDDQVFTVFGDNDGSVRKLDTGTSDDGVGITYALETQDIDFGMRGKKKKISDMDILTENVSKGSMMYRTTHESSDWKSLGKIDKESTNIKKAITGNYFNFKISETVSTGQAKIIGLEFQEGIEVHD